MAYFNNYNSVKVGGNFRIYIMMLQAVGNATSFISHVIKNIIYIYLFPSKLKILLFFLFELLLDVDVFNFSAVITNPKQHNDKLYIQHIWIKRLTFDSRGIQSYNGASE